MSIRSAITATSVFVAVLVGALPAQASTESTTGPSAGVTTGGEQPSTSDDWPWG